MTKPKTPKLDPATLRHVAKLLERSAVQARFNSADSSRPGYWLNREQTVLRWAALLRSMIPEATRLSRKERGG